MKCALWSLGLNASGDEETVGFYVDGHLRRAHRDISSFE